MLNMSDRSFDTGLKSILMTDLGATISQVMKSYTNTFACSGLGASYGAQLSPIFNMYGTRCGINKFLFFNYIDRL